MIDISAILAAHSLRDFLPEPETLREVAENRYRGRCPLCNSSNGLSVFKHDNGHEVFNCFSCNERGSVIDLYSKLNNVTIRRAISILASKDAPKIPIETRLNRLADAHVTSQGKYTLCCVRCPATRQVADDLSAAILMDGGSNWEVAPDGIAAICPKCLSANVDLQSNVGASGRSTIQISSGIPRKSTPRTHLPMSQGALAVL